MQSIEYRYNNDPMVKALVDSLVSAIMNLQLTPSEIRECAMLAAIRYEQSRPTPVRLGSVSEQHLTQQGSEPTEISVDVIWKVIGEKYSGKVAVELVEIMQQQQKLLPC